MKSKKIIFLYTVVGLVLSAMIVLTSSLRASQKSEVVFPKVQLSSVVEPEMVANTVALSELMKVPRSQKCVFVTKKPQVESSAMFYISDGRARGDFENLILVGANRGVHIFTHTILTKNNFFAWDDKNSLGLNVPLYEYTATSSEYKESVYPQMNNVYEYYCIGWKADHSVFAPPPQMQFREMHTRKNI